MLLHVDDRGDLRLEVCDNGTGTVSPRAGGIGLTTMHERAAELGGRLSIRSSPSTGTSSPSPCLGPGGRAVIRVLVVDDHPLFRDGLSGLLETVADVEVVDTAGDGERAVRSALEHRPDVGADGPQPPAAARAGGHPTDRRARTLSGGAGPDQMQVQDRTQAVLRVRGLG